MIRVLHVVSVMDVGGMESFIMNMYRCIDRRQVQFDFLVHHKRRGVFEDEIESLGGVVHHTSLIDDFNLIKYLNDLNRVFSTNKYDIVHGHLGSTAFIYLWMAKRYNIKGRILHAHCPGYVRSLKGRVKDILFKLAPGNANMYLACSEEAGRYLFRDKPFEIINNGVNVKNFFFSQINRREVRLVNGITEEQTVIGHVGRFCPEKNHEYIIDIFKRYHSRHSDSILMLLGTGELQEKIKNKVKELNLSESVMFMGLQKKSDKFYHAMDVFIMPSVYEGLPLAGIEAQCAGLNCIFSSTVSRGIDISGKSTFIETGEINIDSWCDMIECSLLKKNDIRLPVGNYDDFDSAVIADRMLNRYFNLTRK